LLLLNGKDNEKLRCNSYWSGFHGFHSQLLAGQKRIQSAGAVHWFKFFTVMGEILADLSMNEKTGLPVDFLSLKRFQQH
jgi:hypothetical protein